MKRVLLICLGLVVAIFGIAIIFGGPGTPHPMGSIVDPFSSVDFSDLPPPASFTARDGTKLAYRSYAPEASTPGEGCVVLIHGSSATSSSMHQMAKELSAAGFTTYALDVRGMVVPATRARSAISDNWKTISLTSCVRFHRQRL
jgi:hypothetical protein